ncbi:SDR family oxidoreductase [Pseudomonas alloputida]|uniref:SDR family NAD(P)-dependent oxidoreductase n=2 Tax=Pseudomonas TaxID=286 RepID=A0ABD6NI26_9PSED|nr:MULTISPECIES: SDR family oxidoreductase [Pseudomonas]EKT4474440.1 SDR family oxidoreductase [Pseudomonas putida]MCX2705173.1 SDR family NAD(P)-dependent oxidoreductase [Pseudomonas sp. DCB_BG]MDD2138664.1 SDR family oxidoreductase [Pseudomonas putida]MDD2147467.1 SDR family oxidoreductase [Pseudomonas putida]NWL49527.1 SDR family NAD(P)-dependent oxidoreductase [Pseudomonas hunanensis]
MHEAPVTLITGTRKGIGKFLVEHYVARGHQVVGCSRSDIDWELPGYRHFVADVIDEATAKTIFSHIRRDYGRLDNLINNAGIASMNHTMLTPLATVEQILDTNVVGSFLFAREAAKLMSTRKYGRIVNFTTVATPLKLEGEAIYAASKAAVKSLTEVMARELAAFGITVNAVGPTPIETDLIRSVPQDKMQRLLARQAIARFGEMADVANVVDFFISEHSGFVTGQNIYLGGV